MHYDTHREPRTFIFDSFVSVIPQLENVLCAHVSWSRTNDVYCGSCCYYGGGTSEPSWYRECDSIVFTGRLERLWDSYCVTRHQVLYTIV